MTKATPVKGHAVCFENHESIGGAHRTVLQHARPFCSPDLFVAFEFGSVLFMADNPDAKRM